LLTKGAEVNIQNTKGLKSTTRFRFLRYFEKKKKTINMEI
jgi:hypothetical protein